MTLRWTNRSPRPRTRAKGRGTEDLSSTGSRGQGRVGYCTESPIPDLTMTPPLGLSRGPVLRVTNRPKDPGRFLPRPRNSMSRWNPVPSPPLLPPQPTQVPLPFDCRLVPGVRDPSPFLGPSESRGPTPSPCVSTVILEIREVRRKGSVVGERG